MVIEKQKKYASVGESPSGCSDVYSLDSKTAGLFGWYVVDVVNPVSGESVIESDERMVGKTIDDDVD